MSDFRLEELSASNIVAANSLTLKPGQEQFIAPVSYSVAGAFINPSTSWSRAVVDDGEGVVGFIMGNFDPDSKHEEFRSCIWRINVDAEVQSRGVGRFAVLALADEARSRGFERVTVIWEEGDDGPGAFFTRVGFKPVGETEYGEIIGAMEL